MTAVTINNKVSVKSLEEEVQNQQDNKPASDLSNSDLSDYSDDEHQNYFESDKAVVNHLFSQEENNLFKIKNLEEEDQTLEKLKIRSMKNIAEQKAKIDEVDRNIKELQENIERLKMK